MTGVRILAQEEADRLLSEAESGTAVPPDAAPGMAQRAATGLVRGATLGMVGEVPPESGPGERSQRTIPEAVGSAGLSMAALAALSRTPGRVGRWARTILAGARQRPIRAAAVGGTGTLGAGVGAAYGPEAVPVDSPWADFAEPVGAVVGGMASGPAGWIANRGALNTASRRVLDKVLKESNPPLDTTGGLDFTTVPQDVAENLSPGLRVTTAQATQNPGLANLEASIPSGVSEAGRIADIRNAQNQAAVRGLSSGVTGSTADEASQSIRTIAADKIREAEQSVAQAYGSFDPKTRIRALPIIRSANVIINSTDPAVSRAEIPDVARRVFGEIQRGRLNPTSSLDAETIINMRREIARSLARPNVSEAYKEKATELLKAMDDSLSGALGDSYGAFRSAEDSLDVAKRSYGSMASGRGNDIVNRFVDTPASYRELVSAMGSDSEAVSAVKAIIERRMIDSIVGSDGLFDPTKARNFVANRNNMELIEEALGKDHANRVRAISNVMSRLDTQSLIPPGTTRADANTEGMWETVNRQFRRPLDPWTPLGFTRHVIGEVIRVFKVSEKEAMRALMSEALTNPEFLREMLDRSTMRSATGAGRMVSLIGPRLANPIANAREIQSEIEGQESP